MKKIFILIIIMLMLMSNVDKIKEQLGEGDALTGPILSYPNDKEIVYIADKDVTLTNNKTLKKENQLHRKN